MYFIQGLLCGLKQLNPEGGWLSHHPINGWDIETPAIKDDNLKILLQDDLTFINNRIIELENYKKYYGNDIKKITFYTWHKFLYKLYPEFNFIWYPIFLIEHLADAKKHRQSIENSFSFNSKKNKFLCLNARIRPHRDIVFNRIKELNNCVYSYTHRDIKSPLSNDWTIEEYRDWNTFNKEILTNTKNLLVTSPLYNETMFSLVTETRYNLPFDFITEKTTQCFLALHPALFVSNRYHISILRAWGFDVFDDLFDHSYDLLSDNDRIDTLFKNNQSQLENGVILTDDVKQRLLKNREHYLKNFNKMLLDHK
jgi:hypothetical protein